MNKEILLKDIEKIPKFVMRDVAIKAPDVKEYEGLTTQQVYDKLKDEKVVKEAWQEEENWKAVTEEANLVPLAFVSKNYQLVQFSQVFPKLIENIERLEGAVIYYGGVGIMTVFPEDEKLLVNGGDKIGLVAWNSVNKTSSVIIKFCVRHGDRYITMPKTVAGFKRMHVGKAMQITQNFLVVVDKVREVWRSIITEFEKIKVGKEYAANLMDELGIKDKSMRKQVLMEAEQREDMDLWDMFMKMLSLIEERSYKSDVHRRKKLDKISADIFKWAVASRLINA